MCGFNHVFNCRVHEEGDILFVIDDENEAEQAERNYELYWMGETCTLIILFYSVILVIVNADELSITAKFCASLIMLIFTMVTEASYQ